MLSSRSTHSPHLPTEGHVSAKTPGLENAIHRGTNKAAFKSNATVPLHPATQHSNTVSTKSLVREVARPLVDRTPFPNRAAVASNKFKTPLPDNQKLAKLLLEANKTNALFHDSTDGPIPDNVRRISSGRTHVRAPRLSAHNKFVTPLNSGQHWDVSDAEIAAPEILELHVGALESDDYDEIEYMPPKSVETYSPPFEFSLPNYSHVGKTVLNLAQSYMHDDTPPVEIEPTAEPANWNMFTLPKMETDDPFQQSPANVVAASTEKSAPKYSLAHPTSSRSRLGTSHARLGPSNSRPGTSTPGARVSKSYLRLTPNPTSATNTTATSGSKTVLPQAHSQGPNVRRPATAAAMYPSKRASAPLSKRTAPVPVLERTRSDPIAGEFAMLEISSPEIEDDFIFDV
ncbi:hypothetical protein B0H17DRAFT_1219195 [Mycena rosella]|uniref:Uncharacterized protein n=1 Tax=Mycena rosella TaxID=1033263 RepID=A0AAD7BJN8_MYCRO|nr:hypothetical protein B0H17DRAFT_1219195 [Mycena rosella]